jgi:hypothetical protein
MKRIIKLTEQDLQKIVRKVLSEQNTPDTSIIRKMGYGIDTLPKGNTTAQVNINPKGLKFGDGGKQSPNKKNDVIELQKKLIQAKTLNLPKGPTGYFGDLTKKALDAYNQTKSNTTATPSGGDKTGQESSWWDKTKEFCSSPVKRLKNLAVMGISKITSGLNFPPHWRAFLDYLLGRTESMTENFFTKEQQSALANKINNSFAKNKKCIRDKRCGINFYTDTDWSKVKQGTESVVSVPAAKAVGFTLGNTSVIDEGSSYLIKDIYDFNNYQNNPKAYSPENAPETIKNAINKITCGNWIQGLEELASFKQAAGYKGYPVEIRIQKTV